MKINYQISDRICTLVLVFFFLITSEGRQLRRHHDHDYEGSLQETGSRKSVAAPTLIFGNPAVIPSTGRDDATTTTGSSNKRPVSLDLYEEETSRMEGDEAIVRNIMIKRLKREAADRKQIDDEIDEDEAMLKKRRQEAEEMDAEAAAQKKTNKDKMTNSTTTATPTSVINSTLTTTTPPPTKNGTNSGGQLVSPMPLPPPGMNATGPPNKNGTVPRRVVLPPGAALPPGAMFRPGSGPPPRPGQPPFPFPPHLLFGNKNLSVTPKPAKKGELYLPEDYNNLEIPKLDAGKLFGIKVSKLSPVPVLVFLNIRSVRDIDELSEEIVLDLDMKVEWVDGILFDPFNALRSKPTKPTTLNPVFLRKIWQPDIYIDETVRVHKTELMATPHTLLFSPGTGLVSYTFRVAVRLACEMDFFYYPADTHKCVFHLRSYSYFDVDLDLSWLRNGVFLQDPGDPNFDLEADDIQEIKIDQVFHESNNDTYDGLSFTIVARRKLSYHMVQTYLPSVFFIVITWLCFLVPARMVEARIGISMTTLLTLTAMFSSVRESTPIVSYVKAVDIWMVFCIFFVFLTLLEFSLLVWIRSFREDAEEKRLEHERLMQKRRGSGGGKKNGNHDRDPSPSRSVRSEDLKYYESFAEFTEKWAFLIFSVVFILFNIWYWSWLLTASDYFNWNVNATHNGLLDDD
ncbi:glycine receptor subunit alphaZ1 [Folsomia candida]|uniref:glycine receptor subunit alphaZ1 n=1 Tax=Folsomia candida TaxID=158441 RepID=UPI000B8FC03A|nr:glycine receptor subunit alphaZ1 [Folsomia candida]